jgi:tripartite-type tricarboxylate transporter receptor subunit TctC
MDSRLRGNDEKGKRRAIAWGERMTTRRRLRTTLAALASILLLAPAAPAANPVEDFYKGKTIQLLIGYSTGGGYDTYARALARHMGKYIPGNPTIVPQNMPGAGSLKLMNWLYSVAPKDGTAFGTIGRAVALEPLLGGEGTRFDANKMYWIGSVTNEVSICVAWQTSPIKTFDDVLKNELIVGGTGPGADTDMFPIMLKNLLGAKFKLVTGYPGGSDVLLAMERGEVAGRCGWSYSSLTATRPTWLKEGKINILVQVALQKHPEMPEVPLIMDYTKSEQQKEALKLVLVQQLMARPFVLPPDVPKDRVAALRDAFDAVMKDPDFLAEAQKTELEVNPTSGLEIQKLLKNVYASPKDVVALAAAATKQ